MPVIVLAGEEDFLLERRLAELKAKLVDPAWQAFNFVRMVNPPLAEITDSLASLPFGQGNKLILIDRVDLFTRKKTGKSQGDEPGKATKHQLEDFEAALPLVASQTYVVFCCPYNFDSSLKISKIVSAHAEVESFAREKPYPGKYKTKSFDFETWCRKEAKRCDAIIDDKAIHYLLDSNEASLRAVAMEIEKAATYLLPDKHITFEVVTQLSSYHSHVFTLADNWALGERQKALISLDELLSRQNGIPIIAFLQTTISRWLETRACEDKLLHALPSGPGLQRRQMPPNELARKISYEMKSPEWFIEADLRRTKNLTLDWLVAKRVRLCELENLVKSGQMSDRHALVSFISG